MRMQVILDSLFARSGSAPIWGGKKGEFRDWTNFSATSIPTQSKNATDFKFYPNYRIILLEFLTNRTVELLEL